MQLKRFYCPYCNAQYEVTPDVSQISCDYCRRPFKLRWTDREMFAMKKEREVFEIQNVLDQRMRLSNLKHEQFELQKQREELSTKEYNMPFITRNADRFKKQLVFLSLPFVFFLLAFAFLAGHAYKVMIFFFIAGVGSVPLFWAKYKELQADKLDLDSRKVTAETERELFISDKERTLADLAAKLESLAQKISDFTGKAQVSFLAKEYQSDRALRFILEELSSNQGESLHEAIYHYDLLIENEKEKQRKEKQEQLKIEAEMKRRQLEQEREAMRLRYQQEESRMRHEAFMRSQQPVVQQVIVQQPETRPTYEPDYNSGKTISGPPPRACPRCGNTRSWEEIDSNREGYSIGAAAVGAMFLGPAGLAAGLVGHSVKKYRCAHCGFSRKYK